MIATQAEIDLVKGENARRRQMWLPVERGALGELLECPVEVGKLVRLQPSLFAKGTTITVWSVELSTLSAMTDAHARQQGYKFRRDALDAFVASYGAHVGDRAAWVVQFLLGDHTAFFDAHAERYLIRNFGRRSYTTEAKLAAHGEGSAVFGEELERMVLDGNQRDLARKVGETAAAQTLTLEERVTRLQEAASERRVDISRELRAIAQRTQRAERQSSGRAA